MLTIQTATISVQAEKIYGGVQYKIECEHGHKIPADAPAWRSDSGVILCRKHMIAEMTAILDDDE